VRTQFGWHVIRVDERRRTQAPSFDDAREQIRQALLQEEVAGAVERLRGSVNIERVEAPAAAAPLVGTPPPPPAPAGRR
jgi:peptidyl-prolyl cis-trans isomerase C